MLPLSVGLLFLTRPLERPLRSSPYMQDGNSDDKNCGACGKVCPSTQQCLNGACAEQPVACGSTLNYNGVEGDYTFSVAIGNAGDKFDFTYDAKRYPDRMTVTTPDGTVLFTGLFGTPSVGGKDSVDCTCNACKGVVSPNGVTTLTRPAGVTTVLVIVNGYCKDTVWSFKVGCARK